MLTDAERKDIDDTLAYGDPFGGSSAQGLRRNLLSLDSEARKYKETLERIESGVDIALDTDDMIHIGGYLRQIKAMAAKALRNEDISTGRSDPDLTDAEKEAFLADLYDGWVQVGWMPDDILQDTYGVGPLDDGYLTTVEQAARDGGIKPDLIPVYARRADGR